MVTAILKEVNVLPLSTTSNELTQLVGNSSGDDTDFDDRNQSGFSRLASLFEGKTVVITGTFSLTNAMKGGQINRAALIKAIEGLGE